MGSTLCERAYSNASSGPNSAKSLPTEVILGSLKPRAAQCSVLPSVKPILQGLMRWDQGLIRTGQGTVSALATLQPPRHLLTSHVNISLVIPLVNVSLFILHLKPGPAPSLLKRCCVCWGDPQDKAARTGNGEGLCGQRIWPVGYKSPLVQMEVDRVACLCGHGEVQWFSGICEVLWAFKAKTIKKKNW